MNRKEMFDSKWQQIRSQSNGWWSLIVDSDLDKVEKWPVMRDKYVMILQIKYGYTRDQARQEIDSRVAALPVLPSDGEATAAPQPSSSAKPRTSKTKKRTVSGKAGSPTLPS